MIREKDGLFVLATEHTMYAFRILKTGQAEHLYYGKRIESLCREPDAAFALACSRKWTFAPGNTVWYEDAHKDICLEAIPQEWSGVGKGDVREPMVEMCFADGSTTTDFVYESFAISKGKGAFETLPGSYDETGEVDHLCLLLREKCKNVEMELHFFVYEAADCITRSVRFKNTSAEFVTINRALSMQLDLQPGKWEMTTFNGAWTREMNASTTPLLAGTHSNGSICGVSSNRANPFVMVHAAGAGEDAGECYGMNLIYSGNHLELCQVDAFGGVRFLTGMHPMGYAKQLSPGEVYELPEAVMTYSDSGFSTLSCHMHTFVREHIVRGEYKKRVRPVLLNSWEAAYFDIDEGKLCKLAKAAKEVGIELFVMDDGWFGDRTDDTKALGDWAENRKKLPNGVAGLCKKINDMGLDFGIWVEPEMVNVNSKLYALHPDWTMQIPDREQSEGRNQRLLNLGRKEVQEYIIEEMSALFSQANIAYVKWDMNRITSDVYDASLPANRQGEVMDAYYRGLYHCMDTLTKQFPHILFEGCASGGNRFDLGILCYFPQIWASDNTDAICRQTIQNGLSFGYPQSVYTAHVSGCPNHQTLRVTPLETRFAVASFGVLGYECNLCDLKKEELEEIKAQIALYKQWREVFQFGQFYRGDENQWTVVAADKSKAVGSMFQTLAKANGTGNRYKAKGLAPDVCYSFSNLPRQYDVRAFGDLVNTVAPIHIKQDSLLHNVVAKFVKMDGETEQYELYGDALMEAGVVMKQNYGGTGFNDSVRFYQDFASRLYFMERIEKNS